MEPPDPSFADEFNVAQEDAVLVFDTRRACEGLIATRNMIRREYGRGNASCCCAFELYGVASLVRGLLDRKI